MVRPEPRKECDMAKIGTFKKVSGEFRGHITTLSVQAKAVRIALEKDPSGNAPSHRVFIGDVEVGAAWKKTSKEDRAYLSVKLDDPSFPAPIYASLVDADEGYSLIWSRSRQAD